MPKKGVFYAHKKGQKKGIKKVSYLSPIHKFEKMDKKTGVWWEGLVVTGLGLGNLSWFRIGNWRKNTLY